MKINKDDYILVHHVGKKPNLALVIDANRHKADLELGDENPEVDSMITYDPDKVVANVGPEPSFGKVFGVDIEPYRNTIVSKNFGPIHIYRELEAREITALKRAMKNLYPKLKKHRCDITLPIKFRVKPARGKYAGFFKMITRKKDNEVLDYISIMPKIMSDPQYLEYVLAHEIAHSLWFRAVPDDIKARWLKLYLKRLSLTNVKKDRLNSLGKEIVSYQGSINDYMKEMADEDDIILIKEILKWVAKNRRISKREIKLLQDYDCDMLLDLWPTHAELAQAKNDPTEYAMKNVDEFFAESVALKVAEGKKLSADIEKGLKVTLPKMMYIEDQKSLYD